MIKWVVSISVGKSELVLYEGEYPKAAKIKAGLTKLAALFELSYSVKSEKKEYEASKEDVKEAVQKPVSDRPPSNPEE